jgi:hypothetical protein
VLYLEELLRLFYRDNYATKITLYMAIILQVTEAAGAHSVDHPDTASSASTTGAKISLSKATIDNVRKWTADDVKKWIVKNGLEK